MSRFSLAHLSDGSLLSGLTTLVARDRANTALLLAHIAEVDCRGLFRQAAYPSMFAYCVGELRLSEDSAFKRIRAARTARRFPQVFEAIADGRLHLGSVLLLTPYLTDANSSELLAAAFGKNRSQVEALIATRFPRPDLPERLAPIAPVAPIAPAAPLAPVALLTPPAAVCQLAPGPVGGTQVLVNIDSGHAKPGPSPVGLESPENIEGQSMTSSSGHPLSESPSPGLSLATFPYALRSAPPVCCPAPSSTSAPPPAPSSPPRVSQLGPQRFALQVTISQETHAKLQHAKALLSHAIPSGDLASVLDRALDALVRQLEQRKIGACAKPRAAHSASNSNPRYVPSHVKRAVWERDEGRCTFVSGNGRRCEARSFLEFDHRLEVARGGEATVAGLRPRCRAHNQLEAERTYGASFMRAKREMHS